MTSTDVGAFTQEWLEQVATKGKKWRGWILRAQQHAIRQHQRRFDIERWHGYIYKLLTGFGYQLPELSQQVTEDQRPHPYFCGPCKTLFRTKAAWSVHAFKIHGRIDKLRRYLTGSICFGCGSQYHTTRRLLAHLYDIPSTVLAAMHTRLDLQQCNQAATPRTKIWAPNSRYRSYASTRTPQKTQRVK